MVEVKASGDVSSDQPNETSTQNDRAPVEQDQEANMDGKELVDKLEEQKENNDKDNNESSVNDVTLKADINDNVENAVVVDDNDDKDDNVSQVEEGHGQTDDNNNIPIDDLNLDVQNTNNNDHESDNETVRDDETKRKDEESTDNAETPSEQPQRPASAPIASNGQEQQEPDRETAGEAPKAPLSPTGTASTIKAKSNRKHTTTPADGSGLIQPLLPVIPRGQAKVQQIASSISDARKKVIGQPTIYPIRSRVPPKLVRLATVTVSPAKTRPAAQGPSLYYEEPRRPHKVITWDEAHNARPPLRIDMEGPGPCSYSPLNKPLNETNAPCYSFGTKCFPEKPAAIGSRTSWAKSWFQSSHPYHCKADYVREGLWPSPTHYPKPNSLGPRQMTMHQPPSYTFGHKQEFSIIRPGAHKEPSPTDYERQNADRQVLKRGPSFSHQFRREGTILWGCTESSPGPAAYTPLLRQRQQKPSYTIQGLRRSKSHMLGPFSSI